MNAGKNGRKRVLIVDDAPYVTYVLREMLAGQEENYEIVTSSSPLDALAWVRQQSFDLVITDYKMEPINGIALIQEIRAIAPATRFVLITAYGTAEVEAQLEQLQIHNYLNKPFPLEEICEITRQALQAAD